MGCKGSTEKQLHDHHQLMTTLSDQQRRAIQQLLMDGAQTEKQQPAAFAAIVDRPTSGKPESISALTAINDTLCTSSVCSLSSGKSSMSTTPRPPFGEDSLQARLLAEKAFFEQYPEMHTTTRHIGDLRQTEFRRLDPPQEQQPVVYLDYTGGGLHAECQLRDHMTLLSQSTFGNPHSSNPTSQASSKLVEKARADVLSFFHTDASEYDCIFTANCSAALKLVGESYPWQVGSRYMLPTDNHNSVNGIREFAKGKGATVQYLPVEPSTLRLNLDTTLAALRSNNPTMEAAPEAARKLFAFPAQSNFSGVKHPLELIDHAHQAGWDVLLDAAAFAPTSSLDLSTLKPDFVTLSFYKMFGYPTGMGALLVKRTALQPGPNHLLPSRPWFAGGTVEVALAPPLAEKHWLQQDHEGFEDGTINYLNISAVSIGLDFMNQSCGGMDHIATRVRCMTDYLLTELKALRHRPSQEECDEEEEGHRLIQFYGPDTMEDRGGTIALNAFDPEGQPISCWEVEALANQRNISIRAGCFCNPGGSEIAFGWDNEFKERFAGGTGEEELLSHPKLTKGMFSANVKIAGAVRVSVGVPTNFSDLYACVAFFRSLLDRPRKDVAAEVELLLGQKPGPH